MFILNTVTRSIEIVLGGAVATTELPWTASWLDITNATFSASGIAAGNGTTNGGTAVTVVAAPGVGVSRQLKELTARNSDTVAATLTIRYNDTGTTRIVFAAVLAVGDQLQYTDGEGFRVFDSTGAVKSAGLVNPVVTDIFAPIALQTIFVTSAVPAAGGLFQFLINGSVQTRTVDYTLVGQTITWLSLFPIAATDSVVATYQV